MDGALRRLLSEADCALGRLEGVGTVRPNLDLFVAMYVRHEAMLGPPVHRREVRRVRV